MRRSRTKCLTASVLATLAAVMMAGNAAWSQTDGDSSQIAQFNIPAGDLATALKAFGEQSNTDVLFDPQIAASKHTAGLMGKHETEDGLRLLLSEANLKFRIIDGKTVLVESPGITANGSSLTLVQAEAGARDSAVAEEAVAAEAADRAGNSKLEEIVVSAQKRQERLKDVPISISVLSGEVLDSSTAQGLTDALSRVPGVATTVFQQGGETLVTVRGVGVSVAQFNGASPTAYYLDAVPFGLVKTAVGPDANPYDLERVEVLRGPQGTLYGASALNGVVRVITKNPDLNEFEFKARTSLSATEGGDANYRGDMAVNVPLIPGKLAARAVAGYEQQSGWIDRPSIGENGANGSTLRNARIKIGAQPTDELSIGLSAWLNRTDQDQLPLGRDPERSGAPIGEPAATDYNVYGLQVGYDFSLLSVTSTTSYLDYQNESELNIAANPLFTGLSSNVFAQEIILNSAAGGAWRWSLGGMYRDAEDRQLQGHPVFLTVPVDFSNRSESLALFGELTRVFLAGKLELTAGLRHFEDDVTQTENVVFDGTARPRIIANRTFDAVTPRIVLTWHPREKLTVYGSFAEGFRSGFNQDPDVIFAAPTLPAVKPDSIKNYELGAKGIWLDGRVDFDAALYYLDWDDVQQSLSIPFIGSFITAPINGDSASGVGLEFALAARPVERLELGVNFSWNDLGMDSDVLSQGVVLFGEGDRLNYSPESTAGVSADYEFPLGGNGYTGQVSTSANYTSKRAVRTVSNDIQTIWEGDALTYVRGSFSVDSPRRWRATLFVENLNNEDGVPIYGIFNNPDRTVNMRPRTIGLQFEYRY